MKKLLIGLLALGSVSAFAVKEEICVEKARKAAQVFVESNGVDPSTAAKRDSSQIVFEKYKNGRVIILRLPFVSKEDDSTMVIDVEYSNYNPGCFIHSVSVYASDA